MGSNPDEDGSIEEHFSEGEVGHHDSEALSDCGALKRVEEQTNVC
jgi:hypothetical protein